MSSFRSCGTKPRAFWLVSLSLSVFSAALAQDITSFEEQRQSIRAPKANAAVGTDLFGDNVNLYNGTLSFKQTDVSLPGNNALPVMVGRRISTGETIQIGKSFGRWELDIPHLHGTFAHVDGWKSGDRGDARCTGFGAPPTAVGASGTSIWDPSEFWHGSYLYVPGAGDQRLLLRDTNNTQVPGLAADYPIVTSRFWAISCLSTIQNVGSGTYPTAQGEGFLAIAPDGTKYYFDWLVKYPAQTLRRASDTPGATATNNTTQSDSGSPSKSGDAAAVSGSTTATPISESPPSPDVINGASLLRDEIWILPTKVVDRFGNTVTYTYDPQKPKNLTRIASSDGRSLTLSYVLDTNGSNEVVRTVSDGTRTWTYNYHDFPTTTGSTIFSLDKVILPDNSSWDFANFDGLLKQVNYVNNGGCEYQPTVNVLDLTGSIVHPSGAIGTFTLRPTMHGRSHVPRTCFDVSTPPAIPRFFVTEALVSKTITGPGLGSLAWNFDYGPTNESWDDCASCIDTKTVTTTDPNGDVTRYTFGNWKDVNEGRLQLTESGWSGGTALRSVATRYRAFGAGPYIDWVGIGDPSNAGDEGMESRLAPADQTVTTQQGETFTWTATAFDKFARPTSVSRSSRMGSRSETTAYDDNLGKWVLGQVKQVTESSTGKVMVQNEYAQTASATAPATALISVSKFGKLQQSMTYFGDGTVNTVADGASQKTTFSSYMRGIAQNIAYADGKSESAVVNNIGKITSMTNEAGMTTTLGYDAMGRLASIVYPSGDSVVWNPTIVAFSQVQSQEYDLGYGHWKQTVTTGTANEATYFDALWRPVYIERWDSADRSGTVRITKRQYDFAGRTRFESYPKRTAQELSDGVSSDYDALGRLMSRSTNSELGTLYELYGYSNGFQKTYTDAKGNNTYYSYQAFDQPTEDAITSITMPEGAAVNIARDIFGKARSITRSGAGLSQTRSYVYDGYERLCKTIEPETGATVQDYDLANNVSWRASGLSLPSATSCDTASVLAAKKASFIYDTRNRLKDTNFGDGSAAINRTYTPDGLPETVSSNGTKWTYTYNKRRLLEGESLVYGTGTYSIGRTYDANGSLAQLRYPVDNLTVAYNPNALGEPRQVGSYATAVTYYPNGAIAGFTYGSGVRHTTLQNTRGLPSRATDGAIVDESYTYDKNANVESITDLVPSGTASRSMTYDGLNRLKTTAAPNLWGTASYGYDTLDNLISTSITAGQNARSTVHNIDYTTNRLASITNGPANFNFSFFYDGQGNITNRGAQTYQFDLANRMTAALGRATYVYDGLGRRVSVVGTDGVNRIQVYSQAGQLLYTAPSGGSGTKYIYLHNHQIAEVK
jgi:YD repeat-containing protein